METKCLKGEGGVPGEVSQWAPMRVLVPKGCEERKGCYGLTENEVLLSFLVFRFTCEASQSSGWGKRRSGCEEMNRRTLESKKELSISSQEWLDKQSVCWACDAFKAWNNEDAPNISHALNLEIVRVTFAHKETTATPFLCCDKVQRSLNSSDFTGSSERDTRRGSVICFVCEAHLNPVWLNVNTFTVVTIVWTE